MNISGPQYSRATQGLRQRDVIHDQKFKLVFAYPVLAERGLEKYTESIRDFISISMLKEIFINNAINIVKMASQVHPLIDEKGTIYNTIDMVNAAKYGNDYAQNRFGFNREDPLSSAKIELSHKINEKTAVIRELINIDPKLKQLRPYVEIITMNNLIDVPVIVGTYMKDIDPKLLTLILFQSVQHDIPIVGAESVNRIFDLLRNTSNIDLTVAISSALNSVDKKDSSNDIGWMSKALNNTFYMIKDKFFADKEERDLVKRNRYMEQAKKHNIRLNAVKKVIKDINTPQEFGDIFVILDGLKNNIAIDRNNFIEMVDKSKLMNILKYRGFSGSEDVISDTITKHTDSLDNIKHDVNTIFNNALSSKAYIYVMSTCYFLRNVANRALDIESTVKENFYTGEKNLLDSSRSFVEKFLNRFNNIVMPRTPINKLSDKLNTVNGVISNSLNTAVNVIDKTLTPDNMIPLHFDRKDRSVIGFLKDISEMGPRITNYYEGTIKLLDNLFEDLHLSDMRADFERDADYLYNRIIDNISEMRNIVVLRDGEGETDEIAAFKYGVIDYDSGGRSTIAKFRKDFAKYFRMITSTLLLHSVVAGLQSYIDIIKVDIETATSDVLDDLNYTIVMSSETASILSTLINNDSFKKMMNNIHEFRKSKNYSDIKLESPKNIIHLNDNYIKGIVKFLSIKLKFPNVFIIDEKSSTVYYKLMYLSQVQKISLQNISTYNSAALKTSINSNNSMGNIYF